MAFSDHQPLIRRREIFLCTSSHGASEVSALREPAESSAASLSSPASAQAVHVAVGGRKKGDRTRLTITSGPCPAGASERPAMDAFTVHRKRLTRELLANAVEFRSEVNTRAPHCTGPRVPKPAPVRSSFRVQVAPRRGHGLTSRAPVCR